MPGDDAPAAAGGQPAFDTSVPHIARMYDYWLGGKDNFAADRAAGDEAMKSYPDMVSSVRANRAFLARVVRYLAEEAGIRQFLDVGTGIPAANNTHEVAQSIAPECRVVYVDNDPIVLTHARALLTSSPEGATAYIDADLRDTATILEQAAQTLDFSRPVGLMLIAILHMIADDDEAYGSVAQFLDAMPPGSYLAMSHVASDIEPEKMADTWQRLSRLLPTKQAYRSEAEVVRFFDGLEVVEPGVVPVPQWRPDSDMEAGRRSVMRGGVGRKP
jgi:hypothetical protein